MITWIGHGVWPNYIVLPSIGGKKLCKSNPIGLISQHLTLTGLKFNATLNVVFLHYLLLVNLLIVLLFSVTYFVARHSSSPPYTSSFLGYWYLPAFEIVLLFRCTFFSFNHAFLHYKIIFYIPQYTRIWSVEFFKLTFNIIGYSINLLFLLTSANTIYILSQYLPLCISYFITIFFVLFLCYWSVLILDSLSVVWAAGHDLSYQNHSAPKLVGFEKKDGRK